MVAACGIWVCNGSSSSTGPDPPVDTGEPFTEGQIDVEVTMPGRPVMEVFINVFQQIDPSAGDVEQQMKEIIQNQSNEEQQALQEFEESFESEDGPAGLASFFAMMFLPVLDNVICLRDDEETAKFDALTYHDENRYNVAAKSGQYFVHSRWNTKNRISFTYTEEDLFEDLAHTSVNIEFYNIEQPHETETIAGFSAAKSIYTAKDAGNPGGPYKLEGWTSVEMPKSVNFSHPFYMEEEGGIMKITAHLTADENFPIEYEFVNVTSRTVSHPEMLIQQSEPVYDYGEDAETIGLTMSGILFGGSGEGDDQPKNMLHSDYSFVNFPKAPQGMPMATTCGATGKRVSV